MEQETEVIVCKRLERFHCDKSKSMQTECKSPTNRSG